MDKDLDIQIVEAYLTSGVEDQVDYQRFPSTPSRPISRMFYNNISNE